MATKKSEKKSVTPAAAGVPVATDTSVTDESRTYTTPDGTVFLRRFGETTAEMLKRAGAGVPISTDTSVKTRQETLPPETVTPSTTEAPRSTHSIYGTPAYPSPPMCGESNYELAGDDRVAETFSRDSPVVRTDRSLPRSVSRLTCRPVDLDPPCEPKPKKDDKEAEKKAQKSLWLNTYANEYQRQVPKCEAEHGAPDLKEASRRAAACADAMLAGLTAHEKEEVRTREEAKAREMARARLVGPAELIEAPLFHHHADLDHVDELAAAFSNQTRVYDDKFTQFEKRVQALEDATKTTKTNVVAIRKKSR